MNVNTQHSCIVNDNGSSFLSSVESHIDRAMSYLNLPDGLSERIRSCNSTYVVKFGVRLRGKMYTFTAPIRECPIYFMKEPNLETIERWLMLRRFNKLQPRMRR